MEDLFEAVRGGGVAVGVRDGGGVREGKMAAVGFRRRNIVGQVSAETGRDAFLEFLRNAGQVIISLRIRIGISYFNYILI